MVGRHEQCNRKTNKLLCCFRYDKFVQCLVFVGRCVTRRILPACFNAMKSHPDKIRNSLGYLLKSRKMLAIVKKKGWAQAILFILDTNKHSDCEFVTQNQNHPICTEKQSEATLSFPSRMRLETWVNETAFRRPAQRAAKMTGSQLPT